MKQCLLWIYMKNKNINAGSNKSTLIIFVYLYCFINSSCLTNLPIFIDSSLLHMVMI